jgi:hypothetical protein
VRSVSKIFLALALALLALPFPARAQYNGSVSLLTVASTVATNQTCTGTAQNFTTSQNIPNFKNLGQTSHLATATSNASQFQMEIDGIDNLGNVFRLSDLQLGVPSTAKGGLVVTASGYMPNIQISVTCTALATFSISYSGSFSPQPPNIAGALLSSVDKLPFQTQAANANASVTFQTPTGNSQGTIIFQYAAAGPAGSTITAQCLSNANVNLSLFTFSPTTASTAQLFNVSASTCPFVTLSYTSGGASATTYNLEYVFTTSGTTVSSAAVDPCASPNVAKSSAPISIASGNTATTQIIPLVGGKAIFVCSATMGMNLVNTSATETAQFEYGTGANCGTGTTTLTGAILDSSNINGGPLSMTFPSPGTLWSVPTGNALCIAVTLVTGAANSTSVNGSVTYVQQ